ncbi:hypothetical protein [Devosia sp. 66-22]|uniref:phage nozzle protein n=1 Tax=Devosia sp. 66-22 TaxID=1895753 RepID=UPI0009281CF6|nr:hypothetical protein [Devosia sp. 66-22]OJX54729.1 MAG: hypothetical protein BGO81_16550 [Devosia sp. 66-22]
MSLVSTSIPNLVNGVSQQPFALRLSSQCDLQENGLSSVVGGLSKRPPTRFVAKVSNTPFGSAFVHNINRDLSERYAVVITNGDLKVFDLTGAAKTVAFPNGKGYLGAASPETAFTAVTVADYTFILNKTRVVDSLGTLSPTRRPEALVWVRQGGYGLDYSITVDGYTKTLTTPNGDDPVHAKAIATNKIAADLAGAFVGDAAFNAVYECWRTGSTIYFARRNGADFTVTYTDGLGDQAMRLVKDAVQRFSDLPARAFDGFQVRVTGDASSGFDDYWVRYSANASNPNASVWVETLKGGERYRLDPALMPHVLVRESDGTFTFKQATWADRKVGDLDAVPFPSFVGFKIADVFFHRNRLGLVSEENVVLSRAGDYFNFFQSSVTQLLDSDPIDVAASHTKVAQLRHAIPFNEALLLFSDQTQFMLTGGDLLTPNTAAIKQTTEFQCSLAAKPVGAGRNVYFTVNRGSYSAIREYYVEGDTQTNDAADITAHVPKYVPGGVTKLAASSNEDVLVALSPADPSSIYVYKYFWQDLEKLQSSWSKWTFAAGTKVLSAEFVESDLWLLIERSGQVVFEVMSVDAGRTDPSIPFTFNLDERVWASQCTLSYDAGANVTRVTMPYAVGVPGDYEVYGYGAGGYKVGQRIVATWDSGQFVLPGNVTNFLIGRRYTFRYRFSTLVIKEEAAGGGMMSVGEGRIMLRKMSLSYDKSGYFRVEVTPSRREPFRSVFSGRVIGSGNNVLGVPALESGQHPFGVLGQNTTTTIEIINDKPLPCAFLSAEWEAMYVIRSRRL